MANTEPQAMTSERLAEIRRHIDGWLMADVGALTLKNDLVVVLADNEWLRAREAALVAEHEQAMAVVRAVADQDCAQDIDDPEWMQCLACGGGGPTGDSIEHHEICYYVKARALLASAEAEAGEQAAQGDLFDCPSCGGRWRRDELGPTPDILRCPFCGEFCEPHEQAQGEA